MCRLNTTQIDREKNRFCVIFDLLLASSRISVRVKLGLLNVKLHNENRRYIHRLVYQLNEQNLLYHSI